MTQEEFDGWSRITALSREQWLMDQVTWENKQTLLAYKGGENGTYVRVEPDGRLEIGEYEGAIPHIGEALFHIELVNQFDTFVGAMHYLYAQANAPYSLRQMAQRRMR